MKITKKQCVFLTKAAYFLSIFLPLYSSNNIASYIKIFGGFNIIHLLLVICLLLTSYFSKNFISRTDLLVVGYILLACGMYLAGAIKGYENTFVELMWYVIPALFYFIVKFGVRNGLNLLTFMDITYYAMFGNCIFNFIMFLTRNWPFWGFKSFLGTKIGGNYYTVLCLTLSYGIYSLYTKRNRIPVLVVVLDTVLSLWCLIVAQSRSLLFFGLIPICIMLFWGLVDRKSNQNRIGRIVAFLLIIIVAGIFVNKFLNGSSEMLGRLATMSIRSEDDTFMIRIHTFIGNLKVFAENIFGRGFGYPLYYYSSMGNQTHEVYYLDNTFLTQAVRGGIVFVGLHIWILYKTFNKFFKHWKESKDGIVLTIILCFAVFLLNATMMTAQSIHGFAVSVAEWSLISVVLNGDFIHENRVY